VSLSAGPGGHSASPGTPRTPWPGAPRVAPTHLPVPLHGRPADRRGRHGSAELRVNPIACEAHGLCIELLPELITADPWGYPIIAPGPVPADLLALARRAVAVCPTLALLLSDGE
jgi:ferredoxin